MSSIRGWPSSKKKGDTQGQHVTIEPMGQEQNGMTVAAKIFVYQVATDAVESGSTTTVINATAHLAKLGDVIRFTSGALNEIETKVIDVATNSITVADTLTVAPTAADTFQILRPRWANVNAAGELPISLAAAPIQFVKDGVDTEVEEDTAVPANSIPLPVKVLDASGLVPDFATQTTLAAVETKVGSVTETAPATDTASSGLNGRLQRIAQRLTSLIALLPASLGQQVSAASLAVVVASDQSAVPVSGPLTDVQLRASAVPVSAAALPLPTGAATQTTLASVETEIGGLTETAPATDTASSGLNGRLQRIAQRLTSLIALLPTALGSNTSANSFAVVVASDQAAIATKAPVNSAGSAANTGLTATTASTATAPANAVGFILFADADNTSTIRFAIGATASTTVGGRLEPGRDTGYIPCAADVSVCATVSGTNAFFIQWILSA